MEESTVSVSHHQPVIRIRRWQRLKYRLWRFWIGRRRREIVDAFYAELERRFLFGDCNCTRGRTCASCLWEGR